MNSTKTPRKKLKHKKRPLGQNSLRPQIRQSNALLWVFEPFFDHPDYHAKRMFGCEAAYFGEQLTLVLADKTEPWNGVLVCTDRKNHSELMEVFPDLLPHPILGKWLYLSQSHPKFESVAQDLAVRVLKRDPLIGVSPRPKKAKRLD